ncbi:PhzF superfamily (YHI9) (PDB:1SDJ) (PUBMED:24914732) [Commensalibacter communis]|nr:PhzF superfamily (YHI9) (PDB:1SDJ) (PUBMED:24914732) [Commensalibacter communis]
MSETAFAIKSNQDRFELRWFTPGGEIDLCGHATLATAYILMRFFDVKDQIIFDTRSGALKVCQKGDLYELDMPSYQLAPGTITNIIEEAIGIRPQEVWKARDLVCILENEDQVKSVIIDEQKAKILEGLLLHVTARSTKYDCVTRSFAPKLGVLEDPVCGSGHCHIVPLWAKKLNKTTLIALQASQRSGILYCRYDKDRVYLAGKAVLYSINELFLGLLS